MLALPGRPQIVCSVAPKLQQRFGLVPRRGIVQRLEMASHGYLQAFFEQCPEFRRLLALNLAAPYKWQPLVAGGQHS